MAAAVGFTRADYDRLPDDFRVELVDGALLKMPSPAMFHQDLVLRIADALRAGAQPGTVFVGPVDFVVDDRNVLVPDVVALAQPPRRDARSVAAALVVVEVLSPSTAARDRNVKARKYLDARVPEVWLVDPATETVTILRVGESRTYRAEQTAASRAVPGFRLVPARLFAAS